MAGAGEQHIAQAIAAGGHDLVAPGGAWQAGSAWASQHPPNILQWEEKDTDLVDTTAVGWAAMAVWTGCRLRRERKPWEHCCVSGAGT